MTFSGHDDSTINIVMGIIIIVIYLLPCWVTAWFVVPQGKPTQAMKEADSLAYGKLTAKDYIPGAEVLPETSEVKERQNERGI